MRLHTVFIAYQRMELTQQAVASYLETVVLPFTYIIVDNKSSDGTRDWLAESGHPHLLLDRNYYPGYACNRGWEQAPRKATLLQRADNDHLFLPGWCDEVQRTFHRQQRLGQLGLRSDEGDWFCKSNVGGNNLIRRKLWDSGLRYDERPWTAYPAGMSEDSYLSPAVKAMGWRWTRVKKQMIQDLAVPSRRDPYYRRSWGDRRLRHLL